MNSRKFEQNVSSRSPLFIDFPSQTILIIKWVFFRLICKDIYKKGTTKGVDPMPFVGGTVMFV